MSGKVEVLRDRAGVPHVYASSTADVYFGLGFAMAQDRLWQMDRLRRRGLGRQAEILGEAYVESDLMHHAVGIPAIAASEVERTDEPTRTILESFVAGINRQIEACGRELPVEFSLLDYEPEPFTVRDTIAILRAEWWSLNGRLQNLTIGEAARLLPDHLQAAYLEPEAPEIRILPPGSPYPAADPSLQPPGDGRSGTGDSTGSNNWAVAGSHTASGHALLCGDPHQPFWLPSSWYEYAVHGPEDDAAGAGHPGVPGLWWGFNGSIAWALTNNAASTRDLYREEVHPTDPSLYRDGDPWRRFDERTVEVRVRGAAAPVRHTQRATVRGPIVNHVVPALDAAATRPWRCAGWVRNTSTTCARQLPSAAPVIGRRSAPHCATGAWPSSTSSMPTRRVELATSAPVACRSAGASCAATATRMSRPTSGAAPFHSRPCHTWSTRHVATSPVQTSGLPQTTTPIRCTEAGAVVSVPNGFDRHWKAAARATATRASPCRTT